LINRLSVDITIRDAYISTNHTIKVLFLQPRN